MNNELIQTLLSGGAGGLMGMLGGMEGLGAVPPTGPGIPMPTPGQPGLPLPIPGMPDSRWGQPVPMPTPAIPQLPGIPWNNNMDPGFNLSPIPMPKMIQPGMMPPGAGGGGMNNKSVLLDYINRIMQSRQNPGQPQY